jgi:hypothetical protein
VLFIFSLECLLSCPWVRVTFISLFPPKDDEMRTVDASMKGPKELHQPHMLFACMFKAEAYLMYKERVFVWVGSV